MKINITLRLFFIGFSITSLLLFSTADGQRSDIKSVDAPAKSASEQRGGTAINNPMGMEFVYVPPGNFMMGSTDAAVQTAYKQPQIDVGADHAKMEWFTREQPRHRVAIRKGFYMGRYEVTQAQWQAVMGNNPSNFKGCDQCPVEQISWNDAQEFIRKLNAMTDGFTYSLPSEAKWEYAPAQRQSLYLETLYRQCRRTSMATIL
jgi:formylglycine-generating enzyme required for sulfatase activity